MGKKGKNYAKKGPMDEKTTKTYPLVQIHVSFARDLQTHGAWARRSFYNWVKKQ